MNWQSIRHTLKNCICKIKALSTLRKAILGAVTLLLILLFTQLWVLFVPVHSDETILTIARGQNASSIGKTLQEKGIIRSALWFKVLARVTHSDTYLKPGKFVFGGYTNLFETLAKIRSGKSIFITITIPEGLSAYKTFRILERSGIAPMHEFETLNTDPAFITKLTHMDVPSLEGFLYPETYKFSSTVSADSVLAELVHEFFKKAKPVLPTTLTTQEVYRTLTLASIVEDEAMMKDEMPTIASVYWNRLHKNMKLESCPTVGYVLEKQGIHREYLLYKDLDIQSPYNTYAQTGLPPTPICSPSINSIQAALNPAKTNYLFFFADRKGRNIFSATYAEHLQKQKQFKQMQKIR